MALILGDNGLDAIELPVGVATQDHSTERLIHMAAREPMIWLLTAEKIVRGAVVLRPSRPSFIFSDHLTRDPSPPDNDRRWHQLHGGPISRNRRGTEVLPGDFGSDLASIPA